LQMPAASSGMSGFGSMGGGWSGSSFGGLPGLNTDSVFSASNGGGLWGGGGGGSGIESWNSGGGPAALDGGSWDSFQMPGGAAAVSHGAQGLGALGIEEGSDDVEALGANDVEASSPPPREEEIEQPPEKKGSRPGFNLPGQENVFKFYNSTTIQVCVALLIATNFLTNMIEKQMDPRGTLHREHFKVFELLYNIAFTLELGINMYAHWFYFFWGSAWNVFDVVVVTIGVVTTIFTIPKAFTFLRMMRAFRVFRLFKRVKSLNKIIVAIAKAVPGVSNAFLILTIVMCIYAILAVEFYKDVGIGCREPEFVRNYLPFLSGFQTNRKAQSGCFGNEYFGTFSKSIYTFFQVLTGESWSENVARPTIWFYLDPVLSTGTALFFVSFVLITAFVLTNVVVAVLLDKMTADEEEEEEAEPEVPDVILTPNDKKVAKELGKLQGTLGELGSSAVDLQKDFDKAKSDMTEVREQIGLLVKAMERKYRLACL